MGSEPSPLVLYTLSHLDGTLNTALIGSPVTPHHTLSCHTCTQKHGAVIYCSVTKSSFLTVICCCLFLHSATGLLRGKRGLRSYDSLSSSLLPHKLIMFLLSSYLLYEFEMLPYVCELNSSCKSRWMNAISLRIGFR